jgi:hypothetical protein
MVSVLTPAEVVIAARWLAGARPHLAVVAGIVHHEDLWRLCRDELTGVDIRTGGWDIRGRWFGVVVGATPRTGELPRGETIPWRVIAAQIAPREHRGSRLLTAPLSGHQVMINGHALCPGISFIRGCDPCCPPPLRMALWSGGSVI